jgi:hypothetical protein
MKSTPGKGDAGITGLPVGVLLIVVALVFVFILFPAIQP